MKKFLLLLAVAVLGMTACNKEQSSLSLDDVKGRAKVIGTYYYSEGTAYSNGKFSERIKPAADVTVYIRIDNSSFVGSGSVSSNYSVLEAKTDKKGRFEISVPAAENGTTIYIKPADFMGKRYAVEGVENGKVDIKAVDAVFTASQQLLTVRPHEISILEDRIYGFKTYESDIYYPETVTFAVTVGEGSLEYSSAQSAVKPVMKAKANANVLLTVRYDEYENNSSRMYRTYGATTDSKGVATFNVPAKSKDWDNVQYEVAVMPYSASVEFSTGRNTAPLKMEGIYAQYDDGRGYYDFDSLYKQDVAEYNACMVFYPYEEYDNEAYDPDNYPWDELEIE